MSGATDILIKKLADTINSSPAKKVSPYDTQAEVKRVEGDVAWVHIPGGVDETPVQLTTNAKKGDIVQVRVSGGRAWLYGNQTSPPTDDTTAKEAKKEIIVVENDLLVTNQKVDHLETISLTAESAVIRNLEADTAKIHNLTAEQIAADHAAIGNLDVNYAQIDAANINTATIRNAWIDAVMIQSGLIASQGVVYYLDAIQVNAASITAGTIDVERLIVSVPDSQDPTIIHKYMVHIDPITSQPTYEKLDGDVIEDLTITADKIVAGAITADKITTQNIVGSGGWINLRNGTFNYVNATSGQGISWDGSNLLINGSITLTGHSNTLANEVSALQASADGTLIYDHTYEWSGTTSVTFTAHVYRGGEDVTSEFSNEDFTWYYKTEANLTEQALSNNTNNNPANCGKTITISGSTAVKLSDMGYGGEIVGKFTPSLNNRALLRSNYDTLTDSNNRVLETRAGTGDEVRVRDLEYTTTLSTSNALMVVTSETEKLATISTLADVVDKHYVHNQSSSAATWNITHNLNKYPSVTVVDSAGTVVAGDITYVGANSLTVTFRSAFSGKAYLN